jgi:Domain of unknown function (DUF397)
MNWRKSTYSGANGGCVEVADLNDAVALRDSKDPTGPMLHVDRDAWQTFVAGVRGGDLRPL